MSVDPISFLAPLAAPSMQPVMEQAAAPSGQFGEWFASQLSQVNDQLVTADRSVQRLAAGEAANLHEVMISLEEAKLSLQLMMQVRNGVLEAYHDVMRTQL